MKKSVTTFFLIALSAAVLGAGNHGGSGSTASVSGGTNTFIETYDDGTDVGLWHCSVNVPRILETNGGNPGAYIQQGGFSSHVPTWPATRHGFNREVTTRTRLIVSITAIGPPSALRALSSTWTLSKFPTGVPIAQLL